MAWTEAWGKEGEPSWLREGRAEAPGQDWAAEELGGKKAAGRQPEESREVGGEFCPGALHCGPCCPHAGKGGMAERAQEAGRATAL